jgi:1-acyl-sn-glycerol-3-phosphate acyltransferase
MKAPPSLGDRLFATAGAPLGLATAMVRGILPADVAQALDAASRRLSGEYNEDEWGYDAEFVELCAPIADWLYDQWWRVKALGLENVPASGRGLLVANHAGVLPLDAAMIATALRREAPVARDLRYLVLDFAFTVPFASVAIRRFGGVPAAPYNARRLLEQDHLVAVFPEGAKGVAKPYERRYRLERFGRGGFVQIALRTGAPIIPVAVVGSEEIYPKVGESRLLARALGLPFLPITPTFPWLGPLGLVPLPSRWRIEFCEPVDVSSYGPEAADDRNLVLELADAVRAQIQAKVLENVVKRNRAFGP